jgi:CRP/FNR family transcriptional regulator, cyclic AMP receptor protein
MATYQGRFAADGGSDLFRAISVAGRVRLFAQGEVIPAAGTAFQPEGPILVIKSGFVSAVADSESGQNTLLSIRGPGDLVGEYALFGAPSDAYGLTVRAMTEGSAWWVRRDRFRQILHDHPQGWEVLARHLHDRVAAAEDRICLMAGETPGRRLAVFLLQLLSYGQPAHTREDQGQLVPLSMSQTELAEWIGVSRETVERVLSRWVRRGIVRTGRRNLLVRDVRQLEKIAGVRRDVTAQAA